MAQAVGAPPLQYQWQKNGTNLPGATEFFVALTNLQAGDAGDYTVVVSNALGVVSSAAATVDYEDVPTRADHHLFREFFESRGCPSLVCDPRHLAFERGQLLHDGVPIDIVYKRLLVNELLEKKGELRAFLDAARARAFVMANPFRCKPIHKKAIFAVLTEDSLQHLLSEDEQRAIRAHVPWTRRVVEGRATRDGQAVDLPAHIRAHRERLVMKPWIARRIRTPLLIAHDIGDDDVPIAHGYAYTMGTGARLIATDGLGHNRILRDRHVIDSAVNFATRAVRTDRLALAA